MITVRVCSKLKTSWKSVVFTNKVGKNSRYFVGVFSKTIIPLVIANWALHASLAIYHLIYNATRGIIVKFSLQTKRHLKLWEWSFFSQWHRRLEKKKCVYWLLSIWYGDYWPPLVSSPFRCSALTGESLELLRRLKGLSHEYIAVLGHFCAEVISRCLWPLHSILL